MIWVSSYLIWFCVFVFAHDWLYNMHSRWFKISLEHFDAIHYVGLSFYKICIFFFNLSPLLAIYFVL
jgi:hypothetical protein